MKTLDNVRKELWEAGQKYAKACVELGLSEELAIAKYLKEQDSNVDKDTEIIAKCSIAFGYSQNNY